LRGLRYEDPRTGFRFRIPRDYSQIPVQEDERWIVAMFQSKKAFTGSVKDGDSGFGRKPMLKVILFDQDAIDRSSTVELLGGSTITIDRAVPYRDYRDYAKRNLAAGGYYFEMEEQDTIKKVPVTKYEIKIDKSTRDRMRYIAWVFHGDGYDIALEIDLLEAQYRKQRNLIFSSFKSLEFIAREVAAEVEARPASNRDDDTPWEEMSAKDRMESRMAEEDRREKRLRDRLPEDWKVTRSDDLLVMSHGGRSYTKKVTDLAEASRKYLHERFGSISDEYVRRAVIRICRDRDEYIAFALGGSTDAYSLFASGNREIVDYARADLQQPVPALPERQELRCLLLRPVLVARCPDRLHEHRAAQGTEAGLRPHRG
jgi:hypothetical protein